MHLGMQLGLEDADSNYQCVKQMAVLYGLQSIQQLELETF
jgi:hypothetical protein